MDCSFAVVRGLLQLDESMVLDIENLVLFTPSEAQCDLGPQTEEELTHSMFRISTQGQDPR